MKKFFGFKFGSIISIVLSFLIAILIWLYVGYTNNQAASSVVEQLLI